MILVLSIISIDSIVSIIISTTISLIIVIYVFLVSLLSGLLRACCPLGWRTGQPMLPRSQLTSLSSDALRLATTVGETLDPLYRQ